MKKTFPYSDNLASIEHTGDTLTVQFKHKRGPGPVWRYSPVPLAEAEAIANATSPGSTFRRLIVDNAKGTQSKYTAVKVSG